MWKVQHKKKYSIRFVTIWQMFKSNTVLPRCLIQKISSASGSGKHLQRNINWGEVKMLAVCSHSGPLSYPPQQPKTLCKAFIILYLIYCNNLSPTN